MPKKSKVKKIKPGKKKKEKIKLNELKLEELLKQEEEKDAEEKIAKKKISSLKEIQPIDLDDFQGFLEVSEKSSAPVLNKVRGAEDTINLESEIENTSSRNPDTEQMENTTQYAVNVPNYSAIQEDNSQNEQYEPQIGPPILNLREQFVESPENLLLNFGNKRASDRKRRRGVVDAEFTRSEIIKDTRPFDEDRKKYEEFRP